MPHNVASSCAALHGHSVDQFGYGCAASDASRCSIDFNPTSHREAVKCPDRALWQEAEAKEIANMQKHNVFEIVRPGDDSIENKVQNIVDTKFVHKIKRHRDGTLDKCKARLVGRGFSQRAGVDFHETFAPVMSSTSFRHILSLASQRRLRTKEFDVSGAFLTATMHERVYVRAPECMRLPPGTPLRLRKSLHGCRQSGRNFSLEFGSHLTAFGFRQCESDSCVHVYDGGKDCAVIGVHVDDGVLCASSELLESKIVAHLTSKCDLGCLRPLEQFLGLAIDHVDGEMRVHAHKCIKECAHRFGVANANPVHTPSVVGAQLLPGGEPIDPQTPHSELVGSLIYPSTACRPDIAAATNMIARFMSQPNKACWKAAKRMLTHLHTCPRLGLKFSPSPPSKCDISVCSDSDWGGSFDVRGRRRSMTGCLLFHNDNLVAWKSRSQRTPALSVCEAELMAAVDGAKEAMHLRNLSIELGQTPTSMRSLTDSDGAHEMCSKPSCKGRVRHMDLRWGHLRDLIESNIFIMQHVPGASNPSDALTKPLARDRLRTLVDTFMCTV